MKHTKKYMIDNFEAVLAEKELLWLYLCDSQNNNQPDATERESGLDGKVRVQLWRATSASGGYVVIVEGSYPTIMGLDAAIARYRDNTSIHSLPLRVCLERLSVARNRLLDAKYQTACCDSVS